MNTESSTVVLQEISSDLFLLTAIKIASQTLMELEFCCENSESWFTISGYHKRSPLELKKRFWINRESNFVFLENWKINFLPVV